MHTPVRYNMSMSRTFIRPALAALVLSLTVAAFTYYLIHHPDTMRQLGSVSPVVLGLLFVLYGVFLSTLVWIQRATLELCDITLGRRESFLLIMYSSIINFFGPLQSGPAFRAVYLKRRHNIKLRSYTAATLLYYFFYALFSGLFLLTYFIGLWTLAGLLCVVVAASLTLHKFGAKFLPARVRELRLQHAGQLAVATLAQVSVFAVIFYIELNSLAQHVDKVATLIYTGAANFALFVSVTPGAIGFRESFVVFTQQLHHISSPQIVAASLIDRGVYIVFLAVLAVFIFGFHAQNYLKADIKK
jgi:uncharacterized membrane protein YbhN (UPF0104 family)